MKNFIVRFVREDAGQDLIEYAILIGLISVVAIASIKTVGAWVNTQFSTLNTTLAGS